MFYYFIYNLISVNNYIFLVLFNGFLLLLFFFEDRLNTFFILYYNRYAEMLIFCFKEQSPVGS